MEIVDDNTLLKLSGCLKILCFGLVNCNFYSSFISIQGCSGWILLIHFSPTSVKCGSWQNLWCFLFKAYGVGLLTDFTYIIKTNVVFSSPKKENCHHLLTFPHIAANVWLAFFLLEIIDITFMLLQVKVDMDGCCQVPKMTKTHHKGVL